MDIWRADAQGVEIMSGSALRELINDYKLMQSMLKEKEEYAKNLEEALSVQREEMSNEPGWAGVVAGTILGMVFMAVILLEVLL